MGLVSICFIVLIFSKLNYVRKLNQRKFKAIILWPPQKVAWLPRSASQRSTDQHNQNIYFKRCTVSYVNLRHVFTNILDMFLQICHAFYLGCHSFKSKPKGRTQCKNLGDFRGKSWPPWLNIQHLSNGYLPL